MASQESQSLEELVRQYNIVSSPIAALDLETGMVVRLRESLRLVISVTYEHTGSGPVAIIETIAGLERLATDLQLEVWHRNGKPFIIDLPPDDIGSSLPGVSGGGSTPPAPAHDAAGIVPVWRGPKRPN